MDAIWLMTDQREETGYTKDKPTKQRVPISQYGNKAKADKAKADIKKLLTDLTRGK